MYSVLPYTLHDILDLLNRTKAYTECPSLMKDTSRYLDTPTCSDCLLIANGRAIFRCLRIVPAICSRPDRMKLANFHSRRMMANFLPHK